MPMSSSQPKAIPAARSRTPATSTIQPSGVTHLMASPIVSRSRSATSAPTGSCSSLTRQPGAEEAAPRGGSGR
ncbi:hypothetical protein ACFPRL_08825 [Pseudoclavibacter helvolus]